MTRLSTRYWTLRTLLQVSCDLSLILVVFLVACLVSRDLGRPHAVPAAPGISLLCGLLLINTASGLYGPLQERSLYQFMTRAALALVLGLLLSYNVISLLPPEFAQREKLRWLMMACVAAVLAHRVYANWGDATIRPVSRILVLGSGTAAQLVARTIALANRPARIVGYVPCPNEAQSTIDPRQLLHSAVPLKDRALGLGVDQIIVALGDRRGGAMPLQELLDCKSLGVRVLDVSTYFEKMLGQIRIDQLHPGWLIFGNGFNHSFHRDAAKRAFDLVCSCMLLFFAAPLLLVTIACIALESRGPVLYRQERVGQDGKIFSILKFRSMRLDAERNGTPQWASAKDDRVTRIGAIIRRFRIDELPQLLNVFKGEMSLVGPRPERPYFVEKLTAKIPFYALRHTVKPGLTGWAQVRYQYGASMEDALEKLQYDLYYVKNHSLVLDISVLFQTVGVVVSGRGAR